MARRHSRPTRADIFREGNRQTWLVAVGPCYEVLEARSLPPGTDILRTFLVELLSYHDAGWHLSEFDAGSGYFFASKEHAAQRRIYITIDDPTRPAQSLGDPCAPLRR